MSSGLLNILLKLSKNVRCMIYHFGAGPGAPEISPTPKLDCRDSRSVPCKVRLSTEPTWTTPVDGKENWDVRALRIMAPPVVDLHMHPNLVDSE